MGSLKPKLATLKSGVICTMQRASTSHHRHHHVTTSHPEGAPTTAAIMKHNGFTVTVDSPTACAQGYNNLPLPEYPAKDAVHDNVISTYVEARIGKQFSISVENESTHDASVVFYVDGQMASVLLCYAKPRHNRVSCLGVQPEPGLLQRFVFTKANLSDAEEGRDEEVGTIRVVVRRCIVIGYDAQGTYLQFNSQTAIHEKTQKGILDTKTELQAAEVYKNGPYANVVYMDNPTPWAEFKFIYKSQDLLQALGVAPRTSEPTSPLQPKRDLANTEEDRNSKRRRAGLRQRQRQRQRQPTEPLEQHTRPSDNPSKTRTVTIKREHDLIDLTKD